VARRGRGPFAADGDGFLANHLSEAAVAVQQKAVAVVPHHRDRAADENQSLVDHLRVAGHARDAVAFVSGEVGADETLGHTTAFVLAAAGRC